MKGDGSIITVGPSFNISDETRGERPLLCLTVSRTSLPFLYVSPHSTFHSIISYFPLQPLSPSLWPNYFSLRSAPPVLVSPSSVIQCAIISHLHSVSSLLCLSQPLLCSLFSTFRFSTFCPLRSPIFFYHHHIRLSSGRVKSLRNLSVS